MKPKLSIIIPCYNCEKTLREAVDSSYQQDMTETEFEIIMVDDGSTDRTKVLMEEIVKEHTNIRLLFHSLNKGGGAARNTGIRAAQGDIIYCLDSDNLFAPHSVQPMLSCLEETKADGVVFYERRFFIGSNKKRYSTHINTIADRSIKLFDIFNGSGTLLDNFFYTRTAFLRTSGYPEHHGFDTQAFEVRFLSVGNTVRVCPQSLFWHRQAGGEKSYFERVYESGEYSLNMYYILEDIMHILSEEAREVVLNFNVFTETKLGSKNLFGSIVERYKCNEAKLFQTNYERYLQPNGLDVYHKDKGESDILVHALWLYQRRQYAEACLAFLQLSPRYKNSLLLHFNILRCSVGLRGHDPATIEKVTLATSQRFSITKQKIDLNPNLIKRLAYKIKSALS